MNSTIYTITEKNMIKSLSNMDKLFSNIQVNYISSIFLENILVNIDNAYLSIDKVSKISIKNRNIIIKPWNKSYIKIIEKKLIDEDPDWSIVVRNGEIILSLPLLTKEKRLEYSKNAKKIAENAKVDIRNIRRDNNNSLKKNNENLSKDQINKNLKNIQKLTDLFISKIDNSYEDKKKQIMKI